MAFLFRSYVRGLVIQNNREPVHFTTFPSIYRVHEINNHATSLSLCPSRRHPQLYALPLPARLNSSGQAHTIWVAHW